MKNYYIVQHEWPSGHSLYWQAHSDGLLVKLGQFNIVNSILGTTSFRNVDDCETKLRNVLFTGKGKLIRVVQVQLAAEGVKGLQVAGSMPAPPTRRMR